MNINNSTSLFERAQKSIPGGVNSPVRAFKSVGGNPIFIREAKGAYLYDEDGNKYIDYINSWGPMIMGHAYPPVVEAICKKATGSTSFGAPTLLEVEMAELIKDMVPGLDLIRMVSSGTEACMSAIRLARGYTGKNKIIKFEGCYHGHADSFLVKAGSGLATLNIQTVPGVTAAIAGDTLTAQFNNLQEVQQLINEHPNEIAAIITEPVPGNMGCIVPEPGFLQGLRELCTQNNILLIFDEVMTGFRLAKGGAQEVFGVEADLVTYGKVIGAGMPVGAFGGKKEIMQHIAPLGNVYQAGTLSGNPLAMIAGFTLLTELNNKPEIYQQLNTNTTTLHNQLDEVFKKSGIAYTINGLGSMLSIHFSDKPVKNFEDAAAANNSLFNRYFHHCLQNGIYLPPSAFETWFISTAIQQHEIEKTVVVTENFLNSL